MDADSDSEITVRLPPDLKTALDTASEQMKLAASDIVHLALSQFLSTSGSAFGTMDRVRALMGSLDSGIPDLAEKHRTYILESLENPSGPERD